MVTKWFGDASDIGRLDEKMFRAEEMQLIAIEALMMRENPDLAEANRLLNELRAERIEGYTAQTYPGLLAEIIRSAAASWYGRGTACSTRAA